MNIYERTLAYWEARKELPIEVQSLDGAGVREIIDAIPDDEQQELISALRRLC